MKTTQIYNLLLLGAVLLFTNCGDKNHSGTNQKNISAEHPASIAEKAPSSDQTSHAIFSTAIPEAIEKSARKIGLMRRNGGHLTSTKDMFTLMEQWSPVGIPKDKIIELIGDPTSSTLQSITYRFDNGEGGWQWVFDIENGHVSKVHKMSLE